MTNGSKAARGADGARKNALNAWALTLMTGASLASFSFHDAAAQTPASSDDAIIVTAPYRFLAADTSGATNLPLPIEKVPQSISLVSADLIEAANFQNLRDISGYVAGVADGGSQGSFSRQLIRGFLTGNTFSRYLDGLNLPGVRGEPELYFLERVEVVKGPSSTSYGIAPAGGLFNYVSKKAPGEFQGKVGASYGTWDTYRLEGQVGAPLSESVRVLGAGFYEKGDYFINDFDHEDRGVYGAVDFDITPKLSGFVHASYVERESTYNDGYLFTLTGQEPALSRDYFFGDPNSFTNSENLIVTGRLDYEVTPHLSISGRITYQDQETPNQQVYALDLVSAGTFSLIGANTIGKATGLAASLNAVYELDQLGLEDSFISVAATRIDIERDTLIGTINRNGFTTGSILQPQSALYAGLSQWIYSNPRDDLIPTQNNIENMIYSAQAVIKPFDKFSVLLGAAHSDAEAETGETVIRQIDYDAQTSLRGGLIYEALDNTNLYVSFSESFEPQNQIDVNGNLLDPLEATQYEAGVKSKLFNGQLLGTIAVFQITQENAARFDQLVAGIDRFAAIGEVEHTGIEFEAIGQITPTLQINAALSFLKAEITAERNTALIGEDRLFIPNQNASVFLTHTWDSGAFAGLTLGGGARYVGERKTSYTGATPDFDAYTVVDVFASYDIGNWRASLNAKNLFDEEYAENNYETLRFGNDLGEPLNIRAKVELAF